MRPVRALPPLAQEHPEATISKGQRANVPRIYLRRPPAGNGADHPLDLADALEDLSPTGSDGLLKQLTKAVLETAPGQMRCGGRCSRDGAPGLIGVACLPARGLGHPEPGGSGWVSAVPVPSVSARLKAAWVSSARVRGLLPRLLAVW